VEGAEPADGKVGKALRFAPPTPAAKLPASKPAAAPKAPAPKRPAAKRRGYYVQHHWSKDLPLTVRAMVQAGETLFIAGPPDVLDEDEARAGLARPEIKARIAEQDAALMGRKGALLWVVSTKDGGKLAEMKLAVPPVWDGMAAAGGRLYLATVDGKVVCLAGK
ncbi:unnamed protein product, partial [marine sediment metagenome]